MPAMQWARGVLPGRTPVEDAKGPHPNEGSKTGLLTEGYLATRNAMEFFTAEGSFPDPASRTEQLEIPGLIVGNLNGKHELLTIINCVKSET